MNNLLFAAFELPEWLTFGTAISGLISVVGLITAIIKLRSSRTSADAQFGNLATQLSDNCKLLKTVDGFLSGLDKTILTMQSTIATAIDTLQAQGNAINHLAAFVFECFSLSNLSDDNKLKLKILYDKLFYKTDIAIIDELKAEKQELDNIVLAKDKMITELTNKLDNANKQLTNTQTAIRKQRRVSS